MATVEVLAKQEVTAHLNGRVTRFPNGRFVGPAKHLAEERERLAGLQSTSFTVERMGATIGATLHGIDITSDLPDDVIEEIRQALYAYKVIFFRNQCLSAERHVAFAARFGELETHPFIPANTDQPELVRFEKSAEAAGYENVWHHDVTWRQTPSMGAVLHAVAVPDLGGDTLFCDMYAAYEGLSDALREQIDGLDARHDFMHAFGRNVPADKVEEVRQRYPEAIHPVVARHAGTGRRHLYVNRIFTLDVLGLDPSDSAELIEVLCSQADRPEYQCRFKWEKDSVAFWDNRAVQHYASSDYWPHARVMERASIIGDRPTR